MLPEFGRCAVIVSPVSRVTSTRNLLYRRITSLGSKGAMGGKAESDIKWLAFSSFAIVAAAPGR